MKHELLDNEFNAAVSQFPNTKNFLKCSEKLGNLLLEESEDFWKAQGQLALSVLLAHFLSVSKDVRLETFISFVKGIASPITKEDLSEAARERFRDETKRFLTQSPLSLKASIETLQKSFSSSNTIRTGEWIPMSCELPPENVTFVLTSLKWKDRQYVVKKQWTEAEQKNNAKRLSSLYWLALPQLPEEEPNFSEEKQK